MMATSARPPLILSLFLLFVGLAGLGTALLLVALRLEARDHGGFESAAAGPFPVAGIEQPAAAATPTADQDSAPASELATDAPAAEPEEKPAAAPPSDRGPWRVSMEMKGLAPDEAGLAAIEAAVASLAADPEARIRVVGVSNLRLSTRRASQAARSVRERLIAAGADNSRCQTATEQSADVAGIEVRLELAGGER